MRDVFHGEVVHVEDDRLLHHSRLLDLETSLILVHQPFALLHEGGHKVDVILALDRRQHSFEIGL